MNYGNCTKYCTVLFFEYNSAPIYVLLKIYLLPIIFSKNKSQNSVSTLVSNIEHRKQNELFTQKQKINQDKLEYHRHQKLGLPFTTGHEIFKPKLDNTVCMEIVLIISQSSLKPKLLKRVQSSHKSIRMPIGKLRISSLYQNI